MQLTGVAHHVPVAERQPGRTAGADQRDEPVQVSVGNLVVQRRPAYRVRRSGRRPAGSRRGQRSGRGQGDAGASEILSWGQSTSIGRGRRPVCVPKDYHRRIPTQGRDTMHKEARRHPRWVGALAMLLITLWKRFPYHLWRHLPTNGVRESRHALLLFLNRAEIIRWKSRRMLPVAPLKRRRR